MAEFGSLGHFARMDLFAVAPYPKSDFQNDPKTQAVITSAMRRQCKRSKILFITMAVVFFTAIGCGLLGFPLVTIVGLGVMALIFFPFAFMLLYAPTRACPRCGTRMKKDWVILESGRSGEFLICPTCHIYLYTHRTLR